MNLLHPMTQLIVAACLNAGLLRNQAAYCLATAHYESGQYKYMREIWGPTVAQRRYEGRKDLGNVQRGDGNKFMGRGLVMITGRKNYGEWSARLGIDLLNNPLLAEKPEIAVRILVEGMKYGTFTGKKLSDYMTLKRSDFSQARRIINGMDRADLIADYAKKYDKLLKAEGYVAADVFDPWTPSKVPLPPVSNPPAKPAPAPAAKGWFATMIDAIARFLGRK